MLGRVAATEAEKRVGRDRCGRPRQPRSAPPSDASTAVSAANALKVPSATRLWTLFSAAAASDEFRGAAGAQRTVWLDQRLQALSTEDRTVIAEQGRRRLTGRRRYG